MSECPHDFKFQRIGIAEAQRMVEDPATLVLDVRRTEAFGEDARGLPGAVPLLLVPQNQQIPDIPGDQPVLVYCLCDGEASSTRVALWLTQSGSRNVAVLRGGLASWEQAGLPLTPVLPEPATQMSWKPIPNPAEVNDPMVAERVFLGSEGQPTRRQIAVVFVDMVDSTELLQRHSPERVLALFQKFMEVVVDTTMRHCGDVRDFEGDGAMLYFAGVGEALPAVFDLREALDRCRQNDPDIPQARFSVTAGSVVVGYVGSRMRRTVAFIGPESPRVSRRLLPLRRWSNDEDKQVLPRGA